MRILAVDLGKARTGLAVCDEGSFGFPSGRYTGIQPGTPCGCRCRKSRGISCGRNCCRASTQYGRQRGRKRPKRARICRTVARFDRCAGAYAGRARDNHHSARISERHGYAGKEAEGCGRCGGGNDHFRGLSDVPPESEAFVQQLNRVTTMGTDTVSMVVSLLLKFTFVFIQSIEFCRKQEDKLDKYYQLCYAKYE